MQTCRTLWARPQYFRGARKRGTPLRASINQAPPEKKKIMDESRYSSHCLFCYPKAPTWHWGLSAAYGGFRGCRAVTPGYHCGCGLHIPMFPAWPAWFHWSTIDQLWTAIADGFDGTTVDGFGGTGAIGFGGTAANGFGVQTVKGLIESIVVSKLKIWFCVKKKQWNQARWFIFGKKHIFAELTPLCGRRRFFVNERGRGKVLLFHSFFTKFGKVSTFICLPHLNVQALAARLGLQFLQSLYVLPPTIDDDVEYSQSHEQSAPCSTNKPFSTSKQAGKFHESTPIIRKKY